MVQTISLGMLNVSLYTNTNLCLQISKHCFFSIMRQSINLEHLFEGYDHRIANYLDHDLFYDKTVLPKDAAKEELRLKEAEDKEDAGTAQTSSNFSWTSSEKFGARQERRIFNQRSREVTLFL
jgi:hypothetical protein